MTDPRKGPVRNVWIILSPVCIKYEMLEDCCTFKGLVLAHQNAHDRCGRKPRPPPTPPAEERKFFSSDRQLPQQAQTSFTSAMKLKGSPWRRQQHRDVQAAAASYRRHVDVDEDEDEDEAERHRRRREVRWGFRAERYQPLLEQEVVEEETSKREKHRRVGKNVSKAFGCTWKCLMLGLYHLAAVYSRPATVAAAFAPHFSPAGNRP
ncbi:uncharacterized protein LOC144039788 [Vanacampus margaritifer]